MRKHIILAAMATAALFTACSNETEEAAKQSMEVRFCVTNNNLTTRATTSESSSTYTTTFGTDDPITIYSSGLKEEMNGVTGKVNGSNVTINGDATYYYKDLTTTATFNAFYPADATYSAETKTVSFTVAADQSENFDNNEFMVATATGSGSEVNPVALSFEHQLALVVLNLSGLDDATEVTMNSVQPTVKYVFGGTLTTEGEAIDITMNKRGDTQTYWAMVPAQTFAKDLQLFTIKTASATYTYTVTAEAGLTTAKNTIHTITLSKKLNATQLSASISGWNTNPWENGDVEEEAPTPAEPIVLISEAEGTPGSTNVTSIDNRANATSIGWYVYLKSDYSEYMTAEYDNANSAYNLNISNINNWNHRGLCYRVDDSRITASTSKRFKLTIKAHANISNGSLRVCAVNASDFTNFFYIDEQTTSSPYFGITSTSNEYSTLIFDFSKFGVFKSNVFTPIETNYNNVLIYITGINAAGSYFIESISMTEVL